MRFVHVRHPNWPLGLELVFPMPPEGWDEMSQAERLAWLKGHAELQQIEASQPVREWTDR